MVAPAVKVPAVLLTVLWAMVKAAKLAVPLLLRVELVKELAPFMLKCVLLFDICELLAVKFPVTFNAPFVSLVIVLLLLAVRLPKVAVALLEKVDAFVAKLVADNVPAVLDNKLPLANVVAPKVMFAALLIDD